MTASRTAIVTGASAGIGAATAQALAKLGFDLFIGARRAKELSAVAEETGATPIALDVTSVESVQNFVASCPETVDLLVNNAGGAVGLEPIETSLDETWQAMWEVNVLGVLRMTRAILPALKRAPHAHVINLGSVAGFETYPNGSGYTASKHGLRALTRTLRLELLGEPIRITEINPGLVETEFAKNRFGGDARRATEVYRGMTPLTAQDVAECIVFAASRPPHVDIDEITVRPVAQAHSTLVHRVDE